jgi:hypothetical protein
LSVACFYASLACQFTHFIIDSENFQFGEAFELTSSFEVAGPALVVSARNKERHRERERERERESTETDLRGVVKVLVLYHEPCKFYAQDQ